jgi:hypothetical protein
MLPTSGTYNFQSVQVEILIREAFERIGITGEFLDTLKLESAIRGINLLLLEWMDKTTNLWTLRNEFLTLIPGQIQYTLPEYLLDIIQVNLRNSARQTTPTGVAKSNLGTSYDGGGAGNAANAFDNSSSTGCIQTAIDGNISYAFGISNPGPNQVINTATITFVGIQSNVTRDYTLVVEQCHIDDDLADPNSWKPIIEIPEQIYLVGITKWFDVLTPVEAKAYRIREIDGAILNIREIFFNNNLFDFNISNVSRYEYNTYPNKYLQSRPCVYYVDRTITPSLYLWPAPAPQYNCITYSYKKMMQDVGLLTNTIEIPSRMYPALIWGLSYYLALKFNPQVAEIAEAKYEKAFEIAAREDTEDVVISIRGN